MELHKLCTCAIAERLPVRKNGILRIIKRRIKTKTVTGCCDLKYESIAKMYDVQFKFNIETEQTEGYAFVHLGK